MSLISNRVRSRMLVTLKTGEVFDGVLYQADRKAWVLRNAEAVQAGERSANVPLDGEIIVLVSDIAFAQRP